MAVLIDGKMVSEAVKTDVKKDIEKLKSEKGVMPGLAVVLVGENPASVVYVRNKKKSCEECGIKSIEHKLPESVKQEDLLSLIKELNSAKDVHGILVQLPLPKHIDENEVLLAITPEKDVDGFHPMNVGKFMTIKNFEDIVSMKLFVPCTPAGVIELLDRYNIPLKGVEAVIVGRSNIVGKPVSMLLMAKHATVTICHSRTKDLPQVVKRGDIVIAAVGIPEMVKGDWIKNGAAVIDVGVNRIKVEEAVGDSKFKLVGDVEFEKAKESAGYISPVPGGVGPMTIAMLMKNTLMAASR